MEFRFTPEEEKFRQEIRSFLRDELPRTGRTRAAPAGSARVRRTSGSSCAISSASSLTRAGYTSGGPGEHGGMAAGVMMQVIYNEEMSLPPSADTDRRRPRPRRPNDHPLRHRRAEGAPSAGNRERRDRLVPGVQ